MEERCPWCGTLEIYTKYHDEEWGVPEYNSRALWEKLVLDGFQAGLSWLTILKKRDAFRSAFAEFDPIQVGQFTEGDIQRLLQDSGIIRHRGKIEATIRGARLWQEIEAQEGFDHYLWNFVNGQPIQNQFRRMDEVPTATDLSTQVSKDLKKRGFNFCGPTIVYAFMEAVGMVNDHLVTCPRYEEVQVLARP
ncbi:MAG: DNA-3-methyladenine glycosylase I [Rhodobacteraceae bacterium]|nr:DNA-3-methyladenine glycosylase I [Paracoccaceae bacterium]